MEGNDESRVLVIPREMFNTLAAIRQAIHSVDSGLQVAVLKKGRGIELLTPRMFGHSFDPSDFCAHFRKARQGIDHPVSARISFSPGYRADPKKFWKWVGQLETYRSESNPYLQVEHGSKRCGVFAHPQQPLGASRDLAVCYLQD